MLAASIRVDARVEADVGTAVLGDNGTRGVPEEDRLTSRLLVWLPKIQLGLDPLEAVLGIACRTATDYTFPVFLRTLHRLILNVPSPPHYAFIGGLKHRVSENITERVSSMSTAAPPPPAPA